MNVRRGHDHCYQKQRPSRAARGGDDDGERRDEQLFGYAQRFQAQRDHDRAAQSPGYDDDGRGGGDGDGGGAARENDEHGYLEIRPSVQCGHLLRIHAYHQTTVGLVALPTGTGSSGVPISNP